MYTAISDVQGSVEDPTWQSSLPVFHLLSTPAATAMLTEVHTMHSDELAVKDNLLQQFSQLVTPLADGASQTGAAFHAHGTHKHQEQAVRDRLTVAITTWMVRPCVDDARVDHMLQVLTDEMTGY